MPYPKKTIGDLTAFVASGITPRGGNATYVESGPQLVRSQNVLMGSLSLDNVARINPEIFESMRRVRVLFDDVLLNITGASIGRVCRVGIDLGEAVVNQHVAIIRTRKETLSPTFLAYAMRTERLQQTILSGQTGAAQGGFNHQKIRALEIPLPPLPEQHRIVEILDQADTLRQQRRQTDQLSRKILPAIFHEMFGEGQKNCTKTVGDVCNFVSGGTPSKSEETFWTGATPWFTPKDMKSVNLHNSIDHVSETAIEDGRLKLLPPETVLIVVRGMILARTCPVALTRIASTINQDMKGLLPKKGIDSHFLCWSLLTRQQELQSLVKTAGHGTKRFETEALKMLPIAVPPKEQQLAFRQAAENQARQLAQQTTSSAILETLFQTLLHRAFDGSLTAKWREGQAKEVLQEMAIR